MSRALLAGWVFATALTPAAAKEFVSSSPPFHVSLLSLHRQRAVEFVRGPWVLVDELGAQHPTGERPRAGTAVAAPDFYARLRIRTDPPAHFRQSGPVRVDEAVDELGQTLAPVEAAGEDSRARSTAPRTPYTTRDLRLALSLPEQPGRTVQRLRGAIPIVLLARSTQPRSVLDLARIKGQGVSVDGANVCFTDVSVNPDRSATLKLRVRLESEKGGRQNSEYQENVASRVAEVVQLQLDLIDDQSRLVASYASTVVRRNEAYATLTVRPSDAFGAPDRLRVWGLTRISREVPFEFEQVPLP